MAKMPLNAKRVQIPSKLVHVCLLHHANLQLAACEAHNRRRAAIENNATHASHSALLNGSVWAMADY